MKIALWQTAGHPRDIAANLAALEATARQAAAAGTALLLTPECWLSGYNIGDDIRRLAEPADGPAARAIARIAQAHGTAIAYGYAESDPATGRVFNSVQVIGPDGSRLGAYRKTHLFGAAERTLYTAGSRFEAPFAFGGIRFGLLVCYDVEFPEAVRTLALAGAQVVLVPTALAADGAVVPRHLVPARSVESQIYIAYCNHCGAEDGMEFHGHSRVTGPDGEPLAAAQHGEALLYAELHASAAAAAVPYLKDRRPQLYAALG